MSRRSISPDKSGVGSQKRRKIQKSTFVDDEVEGVAGKIKRIVLQNFMCHKNLEFNFGDKVNFLSGKNGSGKSAVLTALVIGLGGRASVTNRGSSLKNFILNGQQRAYIEITLSNSGILAYKKEIYGDEITIIRTITEHTSNYKIISANGKTISTKRDDLDHILMWMNIQVNNPVSILNQDTARTFLKSSDPKDLYKFFMKGTLLEEIGKLYYSVKEEKLPTLERTISIKKQDLNSSGKEILEMKNKLVKLEEHHKYEKEMSITQPELYWARVIENEQELDSEKTILADKESKLFNLRDKIEKREVLEKQLKEKQLVLEEKLRVIKERNEAQENEISQAEKRYTNKKNVYNQKLTESKKLQKKIAHEEKCFQELEAEIEKIKRNCEEAESKRIKISEEKKKLEARLIELNAVKQTTNVHKQQVTDTSANASQNLTAKEHYMNSIINKIKFKKQNLSALRHQRNELSVYSNWMPDLVAAVNSAYERGEFDQKPRGPLGAYIKLKEESWGPAVESLVGPRMLCSFCVHSMKDMKTFDKIIRGLNIPVREKPTVAISKFFNKVHNVSKYEVSHPGYSNLLNALIISDPVVANSLIDQIQMESILLIPTSDEAYGLMEDERNVPVNCKRAITKKGDVFFPQPNYRSYAGQISNRARYLQVSPEEAIRMIEMELESLEREYKDSKKEVDNAKEQFNDAQKKVLELNNDLKKICSQIQTCEVRIVDLSNQDDGGNTDYNFLIEDLQYRQNVIKTTQVALKKIDEETSLVHEECTSAKRELEEFEKSKVSYIDDVNKIQDELMSVKHESCKFVSNWKNYEKQLLSEEERLNRIQIKIKNLEEQNKQALQIAEKCCPRLINVQSVKSLELKLVELKNKMKAIETYLDGTSLQTTAEFEIRISKFQTTLNFIQILLDKLKLLKIRLSSAQSTFTKMRNVICNNLKITFCSLLGMRNYKGDITFDHAKKQLTIVVKANKQAKEGSGTVSLSGGERSFSMVSFIMALWTNMYLPFYVLDEFDVFMDPINRNMVMSLLLAHAKDKPRQQFIFLTPNNLQSAASGDFVAMFRMEDPRS